ncbi:DUF2330 domain-containing protein [Massilia sp. W12]|uniref:DUF2330 domain-containing protein n=1 Tax=Massilia sp. W12 TaxID=3126507 RepID=UPI0030CD9A96
MNMRTISLTSLLPATVLLCSSILSLPAQAFCGFYAGKADASLFNRASQVILARDEDRTVITMQNDYQGPLSEFVLVVPTPQAIKQGQVKIADKEVFARLDAYTAPRLAEYHEKAPECNFSFDWGKQFVADNTVKVFGKAIRRYITNEMSMPAQTVQRGSIANPAAVKVEARFTLEEYDIVSLSAQESSSLESWLLQNGYRLPPGAAAALQPYIRQGMKFFAAKVNLKEKERLGFNYLRPLQFAFQSPKYMLPLRLGMLNAQAGSAQDLIVYALSPHGRVEAANYRTAKLSTNQELPYFIKERFADVYKSYFERQVKQDEMRTVYTEHYWRNEWRFMCDPCVETPPEVKHWQQAGVFWLNDSKKEFAARISGQAIVEADANKLTPVAITRLHLRYNAESFPEDLVLSETRDQENWQVRHVIHHPQYGALQKCIAVLEQKHRCSDECEPRVSKVIALQNSGRASSWRHQTAPVWQAECERACHVAKQDSFRPIINYFQKDVAQRLEREKQTLANLSGWSMAQIEALPGAQENLLHQGMPKTGKASPAPTQIAGKNGR